MSIGNLNDLKTHLKIPLANTNEDAALLLFMAEVEARFKKYLNRPGLEQTTYPNAYYTAPNTDQLPLDETPVVLTGLTVWKDDGGWYGQGNNAFADSTKLTLGTDYILIIDNPDGITSNCGILLSINGPWYAPLTPTATLTPQFRRTPAGNVKVQYTAGYDAASMPADLKLCVYLMIALLRQLTPNGMFYSSEGYQERSVSRYVGDHWDKLIGVAGPIAAPYRRVLLGVVGK